MSSKNKLHFITFCMTFLNLLENPDSSQILITLPKAARGCGALVGSCAF